MPKRLDNVAEVLAQHHDALSRVVSVGMVHELGYLPVVKLPESITYRRTRRAYTHLHVAAYAIGADYPLIGLDGANNRSVDVLPQLDMRLQEGSTAVQGIVCRLRYREFQLPESHFNDGPPDITGLLVPGEYEVIAGSHFQEARIHGDRAIEVGSDGDRGDLSAVTARALSATALAFGEYSQQELVQMAG